jgi:glycosyltransferase involved in cell wall biosynthesis
MLMLGTSPDTRGGIASVVRVYQQHGLFEKYGIRYIVTHCDGSQAKKAARALAALFEYCGALVSRPRLIHIHLSSRASFWRKLPFFLLAFLNRIPTILHLHGAEFAVFHDQECGRARKAMVRFVFDHSDRIVVLSGAWKEWVHGMCANPRVIVIYNPVSVPPVAPWRDRARGDVLSLGKLGERKGSYDLLQAVTKMTTARPDLRLLLGGDGEVERVRARARELGIDDRVRLLGWVRGEEKERLLSSAALYTLPSYNEGLPMSVLEAMAAGLPILTTPVGGIPEAVTHGVEGILVDPGDVRALADALNRLLGDRELARQMGEAARRKVEKLFSANAVLPNVEALYEEMGVRPVPETPKIEGRAA